VFHLSVDPAGTNKQTSDPAGLIYAGQGYVSQEYDENGVRIHRREPQLRILDALEVPSNQVEIVQYMKKYATERPVDQFHVECRSGYTATADMIEAWFGVEVQRHDPGPIKKGVRLQSAAGLIDEGIYDAGGPHAVVLFPGMKLADGTIGPDPQWEWLYDQFLKFGFIKHDHCVDAGTQLINRLAPDLRAGTEGLITRHIIKTSKLNADAELDAEIKRIVAGPVTEIPDEAAADFDVLCLN
ncbi:MAG TPA: hypothetical protein VEB22_03950, partial [Phycisphaerales bacterium]|nr:hypothetical protein [Phycisphaerales bacterium]